MAAPGTETVLIKAALDLSDVRNGASKLYGSIVKETDKAIKTLNKYGETWTKTGQKVDTFTKNVHGMNVAMAKVTTSVKSSSGAVRELVQNFELSGKTGGRGGGMQLIAKTLDDVSISAAKTKETFFGLDSATFKLAARAAIVAPLWMAVRSAYQAVGNTAKELINVQNELAIGMNKVVGTLDATGNAQKIIYNELKNSVVGYAKTSSASVKEITEAMYELGSAGLSASKIQAGFKSVMELSIGSFTGVKEVTRAVAGIMNVYADSLQKVGSEQQQMAYVSNLIADTWKRHQTEVSDIITAFSYLGSVGAATSIRLEDFMAGIGAMSDAMLRGGKGGRLLASAVNELGRNMSELRDLGVVFDANAPINFIDIMTQLNNIYIKQGKSLATNQSFLKVFGAEGSRAIFDILVNWDKFVKDLERTPDAIKNVTKDLSDLAEKNFPKQLSIAWNNFIQSASETMGLPAVLEDWTKSLSEMNKAKKNVDELAASALDLAKNFQLSTDESLALAATLIMLGKRDVGEHVYDLANKKGLSRERIQSIFNNYAAMDVKGLQSLSQNIINRKLKSTTGATGTAGGTGVSPFSIEQIKAIEAVQRQSLSSEQDVKGLTDIEKSEIVIAQEAEKIARWTGEKVSKETIFTALLNQNVELLHSVGLSAEEVAKSFEKVEKHQININAQYKKYNNLVQENLKGSIKGIMSGEAGIGSLFTNFRTLMVDQYRESVSNQLAGMITQSGLGNIFGTSFMTLEQKMRSAHQTVYNWIVKAHVDGTKQAQYKIDVAGGGGTSAGMWTDVASMSGAPVGAFGGGFGGSGFNSWLNAPIGSTAAVAGQRGYGANTPKGVRNLGNRSSLPGKSGGGGASPAAIMQGGMMGFSQYQSARAGGIGQGQAIASGLLTGAGSTLLTVAALNAWNPVGWILAASVLIAGVLTGSLGGKKSSQTSVQVAENRVASKIDVTNKKLELINRNLLALNNTMSTYLLPSSAYFSEKNTLAEEFALSARR